MKKKDENSKKKTTKQLLKEILKVLRSQERIMMQPEIEKQLRDNCSACHGNAHSHSCGRSNLN